MSTPSNSKAAATSKPKPKRPLSGYNLFYRYKRNKILEATSRPSHDNEAVIRAVLTAPPGLEGVPPVSPLSCLPPAQLGQMRAAAIRHAMAGKLFPNENAQKRPHCKVHGMGFVEMGRMMRQAWGQADKLTKDVFCELADVGRVRYRRLMAEYKLSGDHPTNVHVKGAPVEGPVATQNQTSIKSGEAKVAANSTATRAAVAAAVDPVKKEAMASLPATNAKTEEKAKAATLSLIPQQAPSSSDPMLEALSVWATKDPPPAVAAAAIRSAQPKPKKQEGLRPSYGRRVSTDLEFQGPVPCQARSFGRSRGDLFEPLSFNAMINPTTSTSVPVNATEKPGRRVSEELDHYGDSLFEPLPVVTSDAPAAPRIGNRPKWGRRVSTDICKVGGAVADSSAATPGCSTDLEGLRTSIERRQIQLRNAIKKIQRQITQNNSVLPPEMQVHPQDDVSGEKAYLDIMASGAPSLPDGTLVGSDPEEEGVSTRDFMDFIGELDDAIGDHSIDVHAIEKMEDLADGTHSIDIDVAAGAIEAKDCTAMASTDGNLDSIEDGCHAFIFGKPMFDMPGPDFGVKPVSPLQISVPMPAAIELKTNRARMA